MLGVRSQVVAPGRAGHVDAMCALQQDTTPVMRARTTFDVDEMKVVRTEIAQTSACGKRIYTSRKLAATVAAASRRERGENLSAYHCGTCHGMHVGHTPGEPRTIERNINGGKESTITGGVRSSEPIEVGVRPVPGHPAQSGA